MIEEELNKKLIMPSMFGKEFIDLDESFILSTDKQKEANWITNLVSKGSMTINESRKKLGLPRIDTPEADSLIIPYTNIKDNTVGNTEDKETTSTTTQIDEEKEDEE